LLLYNSKTVIIQFFKMLECVNDGFLTVREERKL